MRVKVRKRGIGVDQVVVVPCIIKGKVTAQGSRVSFKCGAEF